MLNSRCRVGCLCHCGSCSSRVDAYQQPPYVMPLPSLTGGIQVEGSATSDTVASEADASAFKKDLNVRKYQIIGETSTLLFIGDHLDPQPLLQAGLPSKSTKSTLLSATMRQVGLIVYGHGVDVHSASLVALSNS